MEVFEQLDVWKRSSRLCVDIYQLLQPAREFGFRDQITRAALSVPSNIAEGYERDSTKEFARFLRIAKGSCGELRSQLYIGKEIGVFEHEAFRRLVREAGEISKMLHGLISKLEAKDKQLLDT